MSLLDEQNHLTVPKVKEVTFLIATVPGKVLLRSLRNVVFCDGDRMSFLLPGDVLRFLHPPSGFGADVTIKVLPLSLERE